MPVQAGSPYVRDTDFELKKIGKAEGIRRRHRQTLKFKTENMTMSDSQKCPNQSCDGWFRVGERPIGMPGGKDREPIDCPHCGETVRFAMTDGWWVTSKVDPPSSIEHAATKRDLADEVAGMINLLGGMVLQDQRVATDVELVKKSYAALDALVDLSTSLTQEGKSNAE